MILKVTYTCVDCVTKVEQTIVKNYVVISSLGQQGASAYQIAVSNGFAGTEQQWLDSLKEKSYIRRHDFVTNVSYCGYAVLGSLDNQSVWNISKITISVSGTTTIAIATNVTWTGRLTHNYT
jgi:hypothetical protein